MADNDLKRRAALYGTLKKVSETVKGDPVHGALKEAFAAPGKNEYMTGARKSVEVDEEWLGRCERALPHFEKAIEQSRSLIKKDGEVVRIDRAKRPSKDSVTHLARHSNLIRSVTDDGRLAPEEIYITSNDEELAVYENRFLYLALTHTQSFVQLRYDEMSRAAAESGVSLRISRTSESRGKTLSYELSVSETLNAGDNAAGLLQQQTMARIRNVLNAVSGFLQSSLMKSVSSAPKLTPPIVRTNIIKNNVDFTEIYELYMFLSSYTGQGYTVNNEVKDGKDVPAETAEYLCDIAALQFFAVYQGIFDGWRESESLYNEEEEERRRTLLKRLRLDVETAKREFMNGERTKEEYIELLETRNAALSGAYEDLGAAVSDLRKKEREDHQTIVRLSAEHDMMKDRMKETQAAAERRIRENAVNIERRAAEEADERIRKKEEAHEKERQTWQSENDLLSARLRAEGLMKNGGNAADDIEDREGFIRLEREHKALGGYFKKQWAKAKRRIRAAEWKNRKRTEEDDG